MRRYTYRLHFSDYRPQPLTEHDIDSTTGAAPTPSGSPDIIGPQPPTDHDIIDSTTGAAPTASGSPDTIPVVIGPQPPTDHDIDSMTGAAPTASGSPNTIPVVVCSVLAFILAGSVALNMVVVLCVWRRKRK